MRIEVALILMMLAPLGMAITPDEIMTGNASVVNGSGITVNSTHLDIISADVDNLTAGNESDPIYWDNKGEELFKASKYNESLEAFEKAIELNQSFSKAWEHEGNALSELGKNEDAAEAYKKAFELDPKITSGCLACGQQGAVEWYWHDKGNGLLLSLGETNKSESKGRLEEAINAYDRAILINPDFSPAWWNKGNALLNLASYHGDLGKFDEAIQAYTRSNEIEPEPEYFEFERTIGDTRYAQGMALKKLGRTSEAKAAFDKDPYMPSWMEFITFTRGQGFDGLLILYDKEDDVTSCDGKLRIEVYEDREYGEELWSESFDVDKGNFSEYNWGFDREATAWKLDRISYDEIQYGAEDPTWYVRAYFDSPDGSILRDTTMI